MARAAWFGLVILAAWPVSGAPPGWPSSRHDPRNTAVTRIDVRPDVVPRAWTFKLTRHVAEFQPGMAVWSSGAIGQVAGRAVVATGSYDRNVYLLDASSGEPIWRFTTGAGVYSAPLIWHDGPRSWIFAASSDRLVYALDAESGRRRWSTPVEAYRPTQGGARLSPPCMGRVRGIDAVFVGHWVWDKSLRNNLQRGGVTALDAREGEVLWTTGFLDNRVGAPLYVEVRGRGWLFAASEDGNLRALDADSGAVIWAHREIEPIMSTPAFLQTPEGSRVFIGSHFGKLRCLDAESGEEIWSFKTGNWITGAPSVYREGDRTLVAFGSYDRRVYALDAITGEPVWSHPTAGPVYSSPAVVPGDPPVVIASSWDHNLYGLSGRDGTLLWSVFTHPPVWDAVTLGTSNWASPSAAWIHDRWMIYFGSYSGMLYAIPLNQADQVGPSRPWSNRRFWLTMLMAMAFTGGVAWYLTRRGRR